MKGKRNQDLSCTVLVMQVFNFKANACFYLMHTYKKKIEITIIVWHDYSIVDKENHPWLIGCDSALQNFDR